MQNDFLEKALHETLLALGQEHLRNLIVVGGWCPYLYSRYVWKTPAPSMFTMDIDFAVRNMTPDRFSEPVYKTLLASKLIPRRIDIDDENRVQFNYLADKVLIPIDFITTTTVLPKGQKTYSTPNVQCNPIPELDVALRAKPILTTIPCSGSPLEVQILSPAAFVIIKSALLYYRGNVNKRGKDFASVAFMMRYAPEPKDILEEMDTLRQSPDFKLAGQHLKKALAREDAVGTNLLVPFYREWNVPESEIRKEIDKDFKPLIETFSKKRFRAEGNLRGKSSVPMETVKSRLAERTDLNPEVKQKVIDILESKMGKPVIESQSLTPDGRIAAAQVLGGEATFEQATKDLPEIQHGVIRALARGRDRGQERGSHSL